MWKYSICNHWWDYILSYRIELGYSIGQWKYKGSNAPALTIINSQQILNYGELSKIINTPQSKKEIDEYHNDPKCLFEKLESKLNLHICALNFEYIFDSLSRTFVGVGQVRRMRTGFLSFSSSPVVSWGSR